MTRNQLTLTIVAAVAALNTVVAAGLKEGDPIPDVSLRTEEDQPVRLQALVAKQPTVLIFYRGGWCPYCNKHLSGLVGIQDELKAAGVQMLAISIDQPSKLKETPDHDELGYTLLSDADATVSEAFGIAFTVPDELVNKYKNSYGIDLEAASGRTHHKLPHPSVYVVGRDGIIRFAHVNENYKVRLRPEKVLEAARAGTR